MFDPPPTLSVFVEAVDPETGRVTVNGVDTEAPTVPFDFDWGDGRAPTTGWFPATHRYADPSASYVVTVTAHYSDNTQATARTLVRFTAPTVAPIPLPPALLVTIADRPVTLATRLGDPPAGLTFFGDEFFPVVPRGLVEHVLSIAAALQYGFANEDLFLVDRAFNQVVLRDPTFLGMYSLWYTSPVAFGCGDDGFSATPRYSSFFHEMGHNVSLNTPSDHYFGGKIDGQANAIYSETMAQIFQHATAHAILNGQGLGLSADLLFDIREDSLATMRVVRSAYDDYLMHGTPYASWDDPGTPEDETFTTFMTVAYKFFEQAELGETGYQAPLKRMMALLQTFDADLEARYDRLHDTEAADLFRSTLLVAAVSYAFDTDLRTEFRELSFPVDDEAHNALMRRR
ncbi:MAG: hypothetical protein JXP73_02605 [Deltaproteobacteria bacterium]|nr:hypothetical protein [Deltaproteobacteria bacterium]